MSRLTNRKQQLTLCEASLNLSVMDQKDIIKRLGGASKVASMLGISTAAVSGWRGKIPPLRVIQLSQITGMPISEFISSNRAGLLGTERD